ncbi:MAG: hypothetical protein AB1349_13105 [Elusimicrobiota bacterium]
MGKRTDQGRNNGVCPYFFTLGFVDGPNEYIYCANNPVLWLDPFGLCRGKNQILSSRIVTQTIGSWGVLIDADFSKPPAEMHPIFSNAATTVKDVTVAGVNNVQDSLDVYINTKVNNDKAVAQATVKVAKPIAQTVHKNAIEIATYTASTLDTVLSHSTFNGNTPVNAIQSAAVPVASSVIGAGGTFETIGSIVGGGIGLGVSSWVPIPGARVVGTLLGSGLGGKMGSLVDNLKGGQNGNLNNYNEEFDILNE